MSPEKTPREDLPDRDRKDQKVADRGTNHQVMVLLVEDPIERGM